MNRNNNNINSDVDEFCTNIDHRTYPDIAEHNNMETLGLMEETGAQIL